MADSGSKTEKATPKKRKDERKKGHAYSSKDIVNVASILVLYTLLKIMFPFSYSRLSIFVEKYMGYASSVDSITDAFSFQILVDCIWAFVYIALPISLISILVAVVATGFQTKFLFSMESLKPKFNRMNPIEGFKRLLSLKSFVEVVKGSIKIAIICVIIYNFFKSRIYNFSQSPFMDISQSAAYLLESVVDLVYRISIIFVFVAGLDYLYQRWDYEKQIKMSKHEVKEEYKQLEGDPKIKGKIKEQQRKFAMSRMMQEVPTADVVIKNPTHFAVALRYDIEKDRAPVVVAKGQDEMALRIIKVAESNGVDVVENKPLARAIFSSSELNMEIPAAYYAAVAEILAVIYGMKNKRG
ncbi:flagellar biosynthesis protein FlhB [Anaerovorax odorimutans]|uniref:flagellar biosynthesis protein FlhB n=1 Tax=Anaerovorax odorimutans TaxID=109327 RepID=UPI0004147D09|nr:flagellar biosynthesis protein FlhB [Anaerovorax odorimutans]